MEPTISFEFRQREYKALYTICKREYPTFIYVSLPDADLTHEFGEEVVIHCSEGKLLSQHVYNSSRVELYNAIFDAILAVSENHNIKTPQEA